jgi:hypothetical protein
LEKVNERLWTSLKVSFIWHGINCYYGIVIPSVLLNERQPTNIFQIQSWKN